MHLFKYAQTRFIALIALIWLALFVMTRSLLLFTHLPEAQLDLGSTLSLYSEGFVYDLVFLLYALAPLALYLLLCPTRLWQSRWNRLLLQAVLTLSIFIMLFTAVSEWLFWDEFSVRFNFIAVDYLVYSDEVLNNILESYPVYPLLAVLALIAVGMTVALRGQMRRVATAPVLAWRQRGLVLTGWALLFGLGIFVVGQDFPRASGGNAYQHELSANGPYQFFAAFRNNELDYEQFYPVLPLQQVASQLRDEVKEPNALFVDADPLSIRRTIDNPGQPKRMNVILVTIESLSAKYLGSEGDTRGLSPELDALRQQSLYFSNLYATGTRTTRGLEAITLSIPPTPGRSIVKRVGRESGFASLGQQFSAQGYDSVFMYGGRGYFDNMNAFFEGNGYRIVDQGSVPDDEVTFTNAWGMSDEDLYQQTLKVADADFAQGSPFFLQLMTTSNHRPYSYPEGRIDIPSGSGREGAVKYTDYAIGEFLRAARQKPWFANTVFIFVADHTAGSAGMEDLPVSNYHIPLFIYAPSLITPADVSTLTSQIDIAPTLLGLLNMDYTSTFFGRNVLRKDAAPGRALIGNYQHLGLFDGTNLAILSPRQMMRRHDDALGESLESSAQQSDPLVARSIAYYEGASYDFTHELLAWHPLVQPSVRVGQK
ncbi:MULTISPECIES: LTA synthase family protein [Pseudomonas]|uniref:LTA synthase family protein n=1 Tax=Pseudomonas neustonica TaxID=2487346 RepID=A0ABX9XJM0_9PSED|nr:MULTISPECIES: LTA synthase family protein [Pseudomonas]MAB24143.1 sulfatase [Pseudomonadales bacterium]MBA6420798.1 sulfatase-like hydrolase/transferase [Pseudomonas sp. 5Ae-yellow]ROZ84532.1 LTA synthase family protein [Pseudomonas sp. SSM44]ROZ86335.1 LTA synthase family protein [Pseudomonas neustonica]|tara:strand:+ start:8934 stop:10892 length:1959 start_codon:yes stop_codon:yes gene_type:complete